MDETEVLEYSPVVKCKAGKQEWDWSPHEAISHSVQVLQMSALIEYESRYYRFLRAKLKNTDHDTRLNTVAGLSRFMPTS